MQHARRLLLIESDAVQMYGTRQDLGELGLIETLVHARSTEEALQYLSRNPQEGPLVILLDLDGL